MDINDLFIFNDVTKDGGRIKLYRKSDTRDDIIPIKDGITFLSEIGWKEIEGVPSEEWEQFLHISTKEVLGLFHDKTLTRYDFTFKLSQEIDDFLKNHTMDVFQHKEYGFYIYRSHTFGGYYLLFQSERARDKFLYGVGICKGEDTNLLRYIWFKNVGEIQKDLKSQEGCF